MLNSVRSSVTSLQGVVLLEEIGCATTSHDQNVPEGYMRYDALLQEAELSHNTIIRLELNATPKDILNLQFTSGSTGLPKSAALTHEGMVNSARYIGLQMEIDETDSIVIPVPLFHAFGLIIGKVFRRSHTDTRN